MEQGIKDKVERIKLKAQVFLNTNTKAFIVDMDDNYYFCDITFVDENFVRVMGFAGTRNGEGTKLFYTDILRFEEYKELEK